LDAHIASERVILNLLSAAMSDGEDCALADRYRQLLTHGATRPHPHAPSHGPFAGVVFRFDRVRDHVLDVLDARATPLPHAPRQHATPGRWGYAVPITDPQPKEIGAAARSWARAEESPT
jgi:hypothetical protein